MTGALVLQMLGGAGFLAGVAAILHFLNTRKATKTKGGAEAYQAYREFVHGATDDRDEEIARLKAEKNVLLEVKVKLIDLYQDMRAIARAKGATRNEVEPFDDRLDVLRRI